jgi:transcription antitermination protein NusB
MGARRSGREAALQMLFQCEAAKIDAASAIELFIRNFEIDAEGKDYAVGLVHGVLDNLRALDSRIVEASVNWRIERMSRVDRNLLRIATHELVSLREVPSAVILDEAIELAKSYGTEESPNFINVPARQPHSATLLA